MNQREIAEIVGLIAHHQVSIHERAVVVPSLMAGLSYQAVFCVPVSELFTGLYDPLQMNIELRLSDMEGRLRDSAAKGRSAEIIARKLEWLWARRNPQLIDALA